MITAIGADIKALQTRDTNYNVSTSTPAAAFAADTYLAGSGLTIPAGKVKVGTIYRCKFNVAKTGAGTATPIITVRVGTAWSYCRYRSCHTDVLGSDCGRGRRYI
jgi:hypothetical protein